MQLALRPASRAEFTAGMMSATKTAMMTIVTNNSTSVKPRAMRFMFMRCLQFRFAAEQAIAYYSPHPTSCQPCRSPSPILHLRRPVDERIPIPPVQLVDVQRIFVDVKRLRQQPETLHLADVFLPRLEAGHVEPLDLFQPPLAGLAHRQQEPVIGVGGGEKDTLCPSPKGRGEAFALHRP